MSALVEPTTSANPRKRATAKASERKDAPAKPKFKATLLLSQEASQRLSIHAAMKGEDRSALVDQLILQHLKEWKVSAWGGRSSGPADPAESEASATQEVSAA
jgi:hypothetical protein